MPLITPETAREMSAKGKIVLQAKRKADKSRLDLIDYCLRRFAEQPPEPVIPVLASEPSNDFRARRLARVRAQLDRIDEMISEETDPQKLDRLANAAWRISEQEFALDGRPKPKPMDMEPGQVRRPGTDPLDRGLLGSMVPPADP